MPLKNMTYYNIIASHDHDLITYIIVCGMYVMTEEKASQIQ